MIKDAEYRKLESGRAETLTNNARYSDFTDFRKIENKRISERIQGRVGQSERSVLPISSVVNGPVMLYQNNVLEKDPLERKKLIADKIVEEAHMRLKQRVIGYRSMLKSPEVGEIIENVTNEAITNDGHGQIVSLGVNEFFPNIAIGDQTKIKLQQDFNNVMQTIFDFNNIARSSFMKFLTEGAQFWEVVYNKEKNKIIGVNHLPSYNMLVIVDRGEIVGFRQILDNEYGGITINPGSTNNGRYSYVDYHVNQILWWDYGAWGNGGINDRMSYLEPAKMYVNCLNNIENAYTKNIITRGFDKRVHYISTGKMPTIKAEEHVRRQAEVLNRRVYFNADDGTILGTERIQAMNEDIFIPLPDGQNPSKIDTLNASANIGEVTPLNYFREKIYQALKYPRNRSRMNTAQSPNSSIGKPGEIDVEQVILTRFIENMQASFGKVLIDLFIMYLETRTEYDDLIKDPKIYRVVFEQSNVFKMIKESEMVNLKLDILQKAKEFLTDHTNGPNDVFAKEFVLKNMIKLSDEEYALNEMLKEKELIKFLRDKERRDELNKQTQTMEVPDDSLGGMGGGGMGDFGGGGMGGGIGSEIGDADLSGDLGGPEGGADLGSTPENTPDLEIPEDK